MTPLPPLASNQESKTCPGKAQRATTESQIRNQKSEIHENHAYRIERSFDLIDYHELITEIGATPPQCAYTDVIPPGSNKALYRIAVE